MEAISLSLVEFVIGIWSVIEVVDRSVLFFVRPSLCEIVKGNRQAVISIQEGRRKTRPRSRRQRE